MYDIIKIRETIILPKKFFYLADKIDFCQSNTFVQIQLPILLSYTYHESCSPEE